MKWYRLQFLSFGRLEHLDYLPPFLSVRPEVPMWRHWLSIKKIYSTLDLHLLQVHYVCIRQVYQSTRICVALLQGLYSKASRTPFMLWQAYIIVSRTACDWYTVYYTQMLHRVGY